MSYPRPLSLSNGALIAFFECRAIRVGKPPRYPQGAWPPAPPKRPLTPHQAQPMTSGLFHLSLAVVRRSKGGSAIAAAAYRSACRIGEHDYTPKARHGEVIALPVYAPHGTPEHLVVDPAGLWMAIEQHCKRKDAVLAIKMDVALPLGLTRKQEQDLTDSFCGWMVDTYGIAITGGRHLHKGRKRENPHLDLIMTTNILGPGGIGKKARKLDPIAGQRSNQKPAELLRAKWAELANQALTEAGRPERLDHRSYQRQGIPKIPQQHMGAAAAAMERRKPGSTDIGSKNTAISKENEELRRTYEHVSNRNRRPSKPKTERSARTRRPRKERRPRSERQPRRLGVPMAISLPEGPSSMAGAGQSGPMDPRSVCGHLGAGLGIRSAGCQPGTSGQSQATRTDSRGDSQSRRETVATGLGIPIIDDQASPLSKT